MENVMILCRAKVLGDVRLIIRAYQIKNDECTFPFVLLVLVIYFMVSGAATSVRIARDGFF
jgi:hypothetical protein